MPKPTTITPQNRPYGEPGGNVVFEFAATGIDGIAKGFADCSYPVLPGNEFGSVYGPNMTTELPPFRDGKNTVTIAIGPNDHPLPTGGVQGEIRLRLFELDGAEWDGGVFGPFTVDIVASQAQTPPNAQPAPVPVAPTVPTSRFANEDIRYGYDLTYANATDIGGNPGATADDTQFRDDVVELVRWRKGERDYPFPKSRSKP